MNCPSCKNVTLVMAERQGVEIDYCSQCRGVWLDRGELDKIIERSERDLVASQSQAGQAPAQPPGAHAWGRDRDDDHQRQHGGYRKKSFWKDIFD